MTIGRSTGLFALSLLTACAPLARERYGDAHYAPERRGYVVGSGADTVLLRDPRTDTKIRCRERLEEVAPALASAIEDRLRDRHHHTVSRAVLLPLSASGHALEYAGAGLFAVSILPGVAAGPPTRRALYQQAGEAFTARRYADAATLYEQALARRNDSPVERTSPHLRDMILYYLAASLEQSGAPGRARDAYQTFVDRGSEENEDAYRYAESALARLGAPVEACASQEPLKMPWKGGAR
jgi:tetratricopeptide (TPR) repeat protein